MKGRKQHWVWVFGELFIKIVIGNLGSSEMFRIFFIFLMKLNYFETPVCAVCVWLSCCPVWLVTCVCNNSSVS
jgi:hypothetical protein